MNKCVTCKKVSGFPFQAPASPPLTSLRFQESRPFAVTGVDFTGELYVRNSKNESKIYICLFTCAATRAVHLEVVSDLSVGTFLLAVRRFASRQSLPDVMISDNATTYQWAIPAIAKHAGDCGANSILESNGRRFVLFHVAPVFYYLRS